MSWIPPENEIATDTWTPPSEELVEHDPEVQTPGVMESIGQSIYKTATEDLNPFHDEGSVVFKTQEDEVKVKLGDVDFGTYPSWMDRFGYGIQDNPQEIANSFMNDNPKGEIMSVKTSFGPRIMYKEDKGSEEPWKPINPTGLSIGDVSGAAPAMVAETTAAVMTGGSSVPVQLMSVWAGTFLGETARQGYQTITDSQDQDLKDQFIQSGASAAFDTTTGGVFHLGSRFLPFPRADVSNKQREMVDKIKEAFPDMDENGAMLMAHQIAHDAPQMVTQARQASAMHRAIPAKAESQAEFAVQKAEELISFTGSPSEINDLLTRGARSWSRNETEAIVQGMPNVREMSIMFKDAIGKDFLKKSKKEINKAYMKVEDFAQRENPAFDISGAQGKAKELLDGIQGETVESIGPASTMMDDFIDITPPATFAVGQLPVENTVSELSKIAKQISSLHHTQPNYNTLKTLRTRLFNIKSTHQFTNDNNKRLANSLYSSLSASLDNPINGAKGFAKAHKAASKLVKDKFKILDNTQIRELLVSDSPATIVERLIKPGNLHSDVIQTLQKYAPNKVPKIKEGIIRKMLLDKQMKPTAIIADMQRNDPYMLDWLAGSKKNVGHIFDMAGDIERINSMPWEPIASAQNDALKAIQLLENPAQTQEFLSRIGLDASGVFYREVLLKDIIEKAIVKNHKTGGFKVDPASLSGAMRRHEKNGMLDALLSPQDKARLSALHDYVQLTGASESDFAVALVTNQLTGKYRSSVAKGNVKGVVNARLQGLYATILSHIITSKYGNSVLLRGLNSPITAYKSRAIGGLAGALVTEQMGDQARSVASPIINDKPPVIEQTPQAKAPSKPLTLAPAMQPQMTAPKVLPPSMRDPNSILGRVSEAREGYENGGLVTPRGSIDRGGIGSLEENRAGISSLIPRREESISNINATLSAINRKAGSVIDVENETYAAISF
jgi:hypothetical protein